MIRFFLSGNYETTDINKVLLILNKRTHFTLAAKVVSVVVPTILVDREC
jgi:hypothetical protein